MPTLKAQENNPEKKLLVRDFNAQEVVELVNQAIASGQIKVSGSGSKDTRSNVQKIVALQDLLRSIEGDNQHAFDETFEFDFLTMDEAIEVLGYNDEAEMVEPLVNNLTTNYSDYIINGNLVFDILYIYSLGFNSDPDNGAEITCTIENATIVVSANEDDTYFFNINAFTVWNHLPGQTDVQENKYIKVHVRFTPPSNEEK